MPYYRFEGYDKRLRIGKIICLARTYRKHAQEMGSRVREKPLIFLKPTSSVIFNNQSIVVPEGVSDLQHEVELGVVIGKRGKDIPIDKAYDHVLAFLVALDITARDVQWEAKKHGWPWTVSKGYDTFCPISKAVMKDKVADSRNLLLQLKVNGVVRQSSNTRNMVYSIEEIISFVSSIMTLEMGDLILTGTPEGVSSLRIGDKLIAQLGDLCTLKVNVV